jgi:hypothetical protein
MGAAGVGGGVLSVLRVVFGMVRKENIICWHYNGFADSRQGCKHEECKVARKESGALIDLLADFEWAQERVGISPPVSLNQHAPNRGTYVAPLLGIPGMGCRKKGNF